MNKFILEKFKLIPNSPGVYLWKNDNGRIIYVGKAINLKKRINQYLKGSINSYKTKKLMEEACDIDYIVCKNNKEALLLEKNLIQQYNPEYNILLLDDKGYPYIKIKLTNSLEISLTKKISFYKHSNEEIYYGPFPSGYGASNILKLLKHEAFYDNGLPIKNVNAEFWKAKFERIKDILSFKNIGYIKDLKQKMIIASENLQFELALMIRKNLEFLNKIKETQVVELQNQKNVDVIVYEKIDNHLHILFTFYRWGIMINFDYQIVDLHLNSEETMLNVIETYYQNKIIPDIILVPNELKKLPIDLIYKTKCFSPSIGENKKILDLAYENLKQNIEKHKFLSNNLKEESFNILNEIAEWINVKKAHKIVIFDNSNISNYDCVGVAITYLNGQKAKDLYRKFNHKNLEYFGNRSDFDYMKNTVYKFFSNSENVDYDLIIVDGGLAQVHAAKQMLKELNLEIPVVGLSKNHLHKTKNLIDLNESIIEIKNSKWLSFLSSIQIEVDRFAKSYFRKRHKISSLAGSLTKIKGLGEKMEEKLLTKFETYSNIYNAPISELMKIVPKSIAIKIKKSQK